MPSQCSHGTLTKPSNDGERDWPFARICNVRMRRTSKWFTSLVTAGYELQFSALLRISISDLIISLRVREHCRKTSCLGRLNNDEKGVLASLYYLCIFFCQVKTTWIIHILDIIIIIVDVVNKTQLECKWERKLFGAS